MLTATATQTASAFTVAVACQTMGTWMFLCVSPQRCHFPTDTSLCRSFSRLTSRRHAVVAGVISAGARPAP